MVNSNLKATITPKTINIIDTKFNNNLIISSNHFL
jgi:hypothetical protein